MSAVLNQTWRYQPWNLVNRLQRDIERTFARELGANEADVNDTADIDRQIVDWTPAVDVRETADAFILTADVPGVDPRNIEVTTENGLLTIRGSRQNEAVNEGKDYRRIERVSGRFLRRFSLPDTANVDGVTAKSNHGVLTLTIPKRAEVQPRRIEIQAA
jgi:HSP20 family protein